jgi:hypothetical protein
VAKKVEDPIISPPRVRPQSVITIGSMEAPVISHDGPIVIEETLAQKQGKTPKEVAREERKERVEGDSKYRQPVWCPRRSNKTQWRKLQHAWHKQQKREMFAKIEGEVLNAKHIESPPKYQNAAATAGQPLSRL